ncbi:MAG TPA: type II secretion system protein, partial [Gallionella sp.]|nr:type II secretion system protein [Gallionella sp.]
MQTPFAAAGFTYIALLIVIAVMGVVLASTGEVWYMAAKREKERELLFVGDQFRRAIKQYAMHSQSTSRRYPMSLEDLLKDERYPNTQRYLRKIYIDPITGSSEWGLLKGLNGEIFGVYSLSEDEPVKKRNFSFADASFEDKKKYAEW